MCGTNWRPSSQSSSAAGRLNLTGSATRVVDPMWRSLVRCINSAEHRYRGRGGDSGGASATARRTGSCATGPTTLSPRIPARRLLARGSLSLASGRIHLELVLAQNEATLLTRAFSQVGPPGNLRVRRGRGVIVWKNRAEIFDLLRRLGAGSSVAEMEARGVLREVRGELNRSINAETANLKRTVRAGMRQAEAIRRLEDAGALDASEPMRRVAEARRIHPDATIAELGAQLHLTRSTVQRSLRSLERQAAALPPRVLP